MKIAATLVLSCAVLAMVKAQEGPLKTVKLPLDMVSEDGLPLPELPEARGDNGDMLMQPQPDQMQRRGGGGKGGDSAPPPPPGWGMPPPMPMGWGGWGAPPMMGWGGMGGMGGPIGYGR